ncbi:hypothetical protein [Corallococcus sp. AB038B]|uniref:hypothetical protein n=1 Tax=Corallococcus sp. AB038B TaxID=2316718 RepID=UPI000EE61815|nr:hypothetical protein [Corallococcus sp. AB038B]RKH92990.1 hypothetical protein D7Y04_41960 [Corallococcus sp. AB038B]
MPDGFLMICSSCPFMTTDPDERDKHQRETHHEFRKRVSIPDVPRPGPVTTDRIAAAMHPPVGDGAAGPACFTCGRSSTHWKQRGEDWLLICESSNLPSSSCTATPLEKPTVDFVAKRVF